MIRINFPMDDFSQVLHRYLLAKTGDKQLVEDISQEAILRLLKQDISKIENKEAWLIRTARNLLMDHFREGTRKIEPLDDEEYNQLDDKLISCQLAFIEELEPESREIIKLVELKGRSQKQVAKALKVTYPTLRSKVQRARRQIKRRFEETCSIEYDVMGRVICCREKSCET